MFSIRLNNVFLISIIATVLYFAYFNTSLGSLFKYIAEGAIIILFIISLLSKKEIRSCRLLEIWSCMLILELIIVFIIPSYAYPYLIADIAELLIPFVITYSSYYLFKCDDNKLIKWLTIISLISVVAIPIIIINTGGFSIMELYRSDINKNQTAPFFAQIGVIAIAICLNYHINNISRIILIITVLLSLAYCVILSARTATIALLIVAVIIILQKYKFKTLFLIPIILCSILLFFGDDIIQLLDSSIVGNRDINNLDSLTSGRVGRAEDSINYIVNNPIIGALGSYGPIWQENYEIPHIFLLWKLLKYGILLGMPFFIVYFSIGIKALLMFKKNWKRYELPLCCLIVAFFTSFSEYSSPFGPGTSYILCYTLFGRALSMENSPHRTSVAYKS